MITAKATNQQPRLEPAAGRPEISAEQWLAGATGNREASRRRLWERLNPRHRKQLLLLARAFALRQSPARLPEPLRACLAAALDDLERLVTRLEKLLAAVATRTPPAD